MPASDVVSRHRGPYDGLIALLARQARWNDVLSVVLQLDPTALQIDREALRPVSEVVSAWRARDLVIVLAPARRQIGPGRERAYRIRIANGEVSGEDIGDAARAAQLAAALFANPADRDVARALGAMIVPPGPETSTLHVLAIGSLGRAPLAALRDATGSLIIARRPLTRVLALQASRPEPVTTRRSVVIGDPLGDLPGAAAEGAVQVDLCAHDREHPRVVPGLLNEIARASTHRFDSDVDARPCRHHDHGNGRVSLLQTREEVETFLP